MISKHDLAKALLNKAREIATANSYVLVPDGSKYEPDQNTTYIQEFVIYGDDNARGIEDSSSDLQFGIYQISVNTPKALSGAKWLGLKIADIFQTGFARGTELTCNSQTVRTKNSSIQPMETDDTHETHILSVTYSVVN